MKSVNDDYIAKAKKLSAEERERVLSRMVGKLPKRLQKEKLTPDEAIAIQLELEDEQLQEWRVNLAAVREKAEKAQLKAAERIAKEKAAKSLKEKESVVTKPKTTPVKTASAKPATAKSTSKANANPKVATKVIAPAKK
jgi:hypothetical protein